MRSSLLTLALTLLTLTTPASALQPTPTDAQIAQHLIDQSIAAYPGPCACPYNRARNGSSCGRRSAYSRAGGYETLCYRKDITQEAIKAYRDQYNPTPANRKRNQ
ncbi:hypothetical protein [Pseudomonas sp.]|uniref:hypothetical protein n=1 Tax=Pseudomonas sp. TaxID=306 RepID=UPI0028AEEEC4|nr:hypothetical protein [Pseudomonas sp.]